MIRYFLEHSVIARKIVFSFLRHFNSNQCVIDGHSFLMMPDDVGVTLEIACTGSYEEQNLKLFKEAIRPGMTVVDIGAHVGLFTLSAARVVGPGGKVIAFEPEANNFNLLKRNVSLNGYCNVECRKQAISSETGHSHFFASPFNTGDHRLFYHGKERKPVEVETISLDDFSEKFHAQIDVIKMDIQGAEGEAFKGMQKVLRSNPQIVLFCELSPSILAEVGTDPLSFLQSIENLGFILHFIDDINLCTIPVTSEILLKKCCFHSYANFMATRECANNSTHHSLD